MQLLISDANILIDLEEGGLLEVFFRLPYQFSVPDILFAEELEDQHAHLVTMGLGVISLGGEAMRDAAELIQRSKGPSRNDCFALALARQEKCPLLTGDRDLRALAKAEAVEVNGTLWVVEELLLKEIIPVEHAREAYRRMQANGRRLPWKEAFQRLHELDGSD